MMRKRLLAAMPDIAAALDKVENAPIRRTPTHSGAPRKSRTIPMQRVKPCKGAASYKAVDWSKVAAKKAKWDNVDTSRVVVSSGRKRRKRP